MGYVLIQISTNRYFSRLIVVKIVFEKLAGRLKEVIIIKKTLLGTTRRWPRPLNRGGRSMEVLSLIIYTKYFWDFDMWPFNRVWPLNRGPLNGGSTVIAFWGQLFTARLKTGFHFNRIVAKRSVFHCVHIICSA